MMTATFNLSGMWMTLYRLNDILHIRLFSRTIGFRWFLKINFFGLYLTQAEIRQCIVLGNEFRSNHWEQYAGYSAYGIIRK